MNKIKIGSIGLGRLGLQHAENIASKIENAELVALCDMNKRYYSQPILLLVIKILLFPTSPKKLFRGN